MEWDPDAEEGLRRFLRQHGYPEEAFIRDWPVGSLRADLAVVDPKTKVPIAIFEFKRSDPASLAMGEQQLKKFAEALAPYNPPLYLVYRKGDTELGFRRFQRDEPPRDVIRPVENLPEERRKSVQRAREAIRQGDNVRVARLKRIALGWAAVVFTVFVLDLAAVLQLTARQGFLLAGAIGLSVIPFVKRWSFLGMGMENFPPEDEVK